MSEYFQNFNHLIKIYPMHNPKLPNIQMVLLPTVSPKAIHKGKRLIKTIIDHVYNIIGHFGQFKMSQYIRRYFWWPSMSHDIESYCKTYSICMTSKDTNSKPIGLLHSLPIPDRPWQSIGLDFMGPPQNQIILIIC